MSGQQVGVFTGLMKRFALWSPSDTSCKMPDCTAPRYVDPYTQRIHDFCGRSHAREYQALMEAQKAAEERQKRLKRQQKNQRKGKNQGTGVDQQDCNNCLACGGPGLAYSVMTYQPPYGPIRFYNREDPYYEFTNFHRASILLDGVVWPTTEHYFQAQKFIGTPFTEIIRRFDSPRQAFDLSRNPAVSCWRRKDWEEVKVDIMRKALLAKFTQHDDLRQMLLGTMDRRLIEHTPYDSFWGDGGDGNGKNQLGKLLMELREYIQSMWRTSGTAITQQPRPAAAMGGSSSHTLSGGSSTSSTFSMKSASSRVSADGVGEGKGDVHHGLTQGGSEENSDDYMTPSGTPPDPPESPESNLPTLPEPAGVQVVPDNNSILPQSPGSNSPALPLQSAEPAEVQVDNSVLPQSSGSNSAPIPPPPGLLPLESGPSKVPVANLIDFSEPGGDNEEAQMDRLMAPVNMPVPLLELSLTASVPPNDSITGDNGTSNQQSEIAAAGQSLSENEQNPLPKQEIGVCVSAIVDGTSDSGAVNEITNQPAVNVVLQIPSSVVSPTATVALAVEHKPPEATMVNPECDDGFVQTLTLATSQLMTDHTNQGTTVQSQHLTSEDDTEPTAHDTQEAMDIGTTVNGNVTPNAQLAAGDIPDTQAVTMTGDPAMDVGETGGEPETESQEVEGMDTSNQD